MIGTYKTHGIILSRKNLGEADKMVNVFTRSFGKRRMFAKGIRKINSRRASYLEPFTYVELLLYQGKISEQIREVWAIESFSYIRQGLERMVYAYIGLELVNRLTAEHQESEVIFNQLRNFLTELNDKNTSRTMAQDSLSKFKRRLLLELGFAQIKSHAIEEILFDVLESKLKSELLLTNIQKNHIISIDAMTSRA